MDAPELNVLVSRLKPALEASLDCVAVVNAVNQVVYANLSMKNLLGLKGRELKRLPVFCDILRLAACEQSCQVLEMIQSGTVLKLDEAPCVVGEQKLRVILKGVPLFAADLSGLPRTALDAPIGAILSLRNSTGEILLSAKYHKSLQIIRIHENRIAELEDKLNKAQSVLRRARQGMSYD
jgi:hypothetical protein